MIRVLHSGFRKMLSERDIDRYLHLMPISIEWKIRRYRRWQDTQSALIGKLLLLEGLKEQGYPENCLDRMGLDRSGRPCLDERIDFNISHSEEGAVCALSVRGRLGVDLERVRPIDLLHFRAWLTPKEWTSLTESGDPCREFYRLWTMKESVLKADGRGLSASMAHIDITGQTAVLDGHLWFLNEIEVDPDSMCHVASSLPCPQILTREMFF